MGPFEAEARGNGTVLRRAVHFYNDRLGSSGGPAVDCAELARLLVDVEHT